MSRIKFLDGLANIVNQLANRRSAVATNVVVSPRLDDSQLREIYKTGLGSKIIRIKSGYALNDTLQFKSDKDARIYKEKIERSVKKAAKFMLGFGRGIVVLNERGADLSTPARDVDMGRVKLEVFSGDMVSVQDASFDLNSDRYQRPRFYSVRGHLIHYTRVIDFCHYMPTEQDLPTYRYGGISEFQLIHTQLINDGIVERASGTILEKNSTLFHKIAGFKDSIRCGDDDALIDYYSKLAEVRGIYGDGIIDKDDDVINVAQTLADLDKVDNVSLRRLAMVTSIPLPILVGESIGGLNSTGAQERQSFQDMTEALQYDYLLDPICDLCERYGLHGVTFKENQGGTANERLDFETKVIDNAVKLDTLGEDYRAYLKEHDIIKRDPWADLFAAPDEAEEDVELDLSALMGGQQ